MSGSPSMNVEVVNLDEFKNTVLIWLHNQALGLLMAEGMNDDVPSFEIIVDGSTRGVFITGVQAAEAKDYYPHTLLVSVSTYKEEEGDITTFVILL